jgi:hypothetical protein
MFVGMKRTLSFLGAAGTVTGSCYLLQIEGNKLLVDCGLFQGYKQLRLSRDFAPFEVERPRLRVLPIQDWQEGTHGDEAPTSGAGRFWSLYGCAQ